MSSKIPDYTVLVNSIEIRDTTTHTYRTDAPNSLLSNQYINILELGDAVPRIKAFGIFISNTAKETLSVTWITNITNDKTYSDLTLGSPAPYTVAASDDDFHTLNFDNNPMQYISVQLSYSTAPTSGNVLGYLYLYH